MGELSRQLGLAGALSIGVGGTIGGGIFVLVGTAAGRAGPSTLVSFAIAFCGALLIAVPYAELSCRYPKAGGAYAFSREVLGRKLGFLSGWNYWGSYLFVSGYVTLGFGGYLSYLTGLGRLYGSLILVLAITLVNVAGIRTSGRTQTVLVFVAIGALSAYAISGIPHVNAANLTPFFPMGAGGTISASLVAFLAFGGFDMIASAGEEIKDPERNLPRAIILTLAVVLGLYLAVVLVSIGTTSWMVIGGTADPLSVSAEFFLGKLGARLIAIAAVITTSATAGAVLIVTSRVSFAMSRDGLFPHILSRTDSRRNSPYVAVVVNGFLLGAIVLTNSIDFAVAVGGFLFTLHFLFPLTSLSRLKLRERAEGMEGRRLPFRTPYPALVIPGAFAISFLLIYSSGVMGIIAGACWMAIGYVILRIFQGLAPERFRSA